jgi:hypothetical protein
MARTKEIDELKKFLNELSLEDKAALLALLLDDIAIAVEVAPNKSLMYEPNEMDVSSNGDAVQIYVTPEEPVLDALKVVGLIRHH